MESDRSTHCGKSDARNSFFHGWWSKCGGGPSSRWRLFAACTFGELGWQLRPYLPALHFFVYASQHQRPCMLPPHLPDAAMPSCLFLSSPPPPLLPIACRLGCNRAHPLFSPASRIQLNDFDYNGTGLTKCPFSAVYCGQWKGGLLTNNQKNGRHSTVVKSSCAKRQEDSDEFAENTIDKQVLAFERNLRQQGSVERSEVPLDEGNLHPPPSAGSNVMNIIVVAAECAPWSKTGGIGDVAGNLPKALARRGHRVMVVTPRYDNYVEAKEVGLINRYRSDGQNWEITYYHSHTDGVDFVFMDSPIFHNIGNNIYGGNRRDILKRMVLLCKASVEVPWHVPCDGVCYGDKNLVFIANDWHTSLLPVYLQAYYRDNGKMRDARSVLVIHNLAHQGRGPMDDFSTLDLPDNYIHHFKLYDPVRGEHLNILAAGLNSADRVVTVSHGYAWELRTPEGGCGLHGVINSIFWKFHGIVNGIDVKNWSPKFDVHLSSDGYTNYDVESFRQGKVQCKASLQRELSLPVRDDVPIIAFIGRLDDQKGVDLIAEATHWFVGQDLQLVMLGTGRRDLEDILRRLETEHRQKVRGWVGFSEKMAHRITAGADIILMPSRFEPCGLNQLYAMMYGTIPVVHSVGGLKDTVQQFDPLNEIGLGWTFDRAQTHKMIKALNDCLSTYRNARKTWEALQVRVMTQDFSWDNAAQRYEQVLVDARLCFSAS